MEEAALFGGVKVDGGQGGAQATAAIVNDQFQAGFAAEALLFQLAQEGEPAFGIFAVGQAAKPRPPGGRCPARRPKRSSKQRLRRLLTGRRGRGRQCATGRWRTVA